MNNYLRVNKISLENNKVFPLIDIIKFICAIFVVAIHSGIASNEQSTIQWYIMNVVLRLAVPFFFIASGFLFGRKYLKNRKKLKENSITQIKRLLIPFIFWAIVTIPFVIHENFNFNGNWINFILKLVRLIMFNGYHLWFILALIVAICTEYIFLKKNKLGIAIGLSIILYGIALIGNSYYFLIEGTQIQKFIDIVLDFFVKIRNGIFVGFPLFTAGICVAFYEGKMSKISNKKLCIAFIFFCVTQIIEATFIRGKHYIDDHSIFISSIFITIIVLTFCIKYNKIEIKMDTKLLRNLSIGIYYMHYPLMGYLSILTPCKDAWSKFLVTTFIVIIFNLILLKINNKYINLLIK